MDQVHVVDSASNAAVAGGTAPTNGRTPRRAGRGRPRTPIERAAVIAALAIVLGSLFVTTYSLALGDPVPHRIDAALVGDPGSHHRTVEAVQGVAENALEFGRYGSVTAALNAIELQEVYAALDLRSARPTLYVASAAGASVARILERVSATDPRVRVVDTHPLAPTDPNGLDIFYLMLVGTIVGFLTVLQVRANAGGLRLGHWAAFVVGFALVASLVLTLVDGPILHRLDLPVPEVWGILAVHILAVASFASVMTVLIGRWAIVPVWVFFVVLGNSSSGGAVSPPLLPAPVAFVSQWLPSGATVTSLRDAIYFPGYQHPRPILIMAAWAGVLFGAMLIASHRRGTSPAMPDDRPACDLGVTRTPDRPLAVMTSLARAPRLADNQRDQAQAEGAR
jgi:hypothetical protein